MRIYSAKLPKGHLTRLPEADRSLFLLLGHVSNEINVLQKLMLMMRQDDPPSRVVDIVEAGQVMIIMRILVAKLHEAYRVFNERVQGDAAIRERYNVRGEWSGRELLRELNARFKQGSLLTRIRDKLASHYVDEDRLLEASFQALADDEPWELYLSETVGNSFYYASEMVAMKAALDLVAADPVPDEKPDETNLKALFNESLEVANVVMKLCQVIMIEILEKSIAGELVMEPIDIGKPPKLAALHLPFFVDVTDLNGPGRGLPQND